MNTLTRKITLFLASILYSFSQVILGYAMESNVWKERRQQLASLPADWSPPPSSLMEKLPENLFSSGPQLSSKLRDLVSAVPPSLATLHEAYDSKNPNTNPLVIIQDIHMNAEAQSNIAGILESFISKKKLAVIGIEGAFDPLDFTPFRSVSNKRLMSEVASSYMKKNKLAAPSYVGITSQVEPPPLIGVDSRVSYKANVAAYLASRSSQKRAEKELKAEINRFEMKRQSLLSGDLRKFDDLRTAYHRGALNFGQYVFHLAELTKADDFTLQQFLEAYSMESSLNFNLVERERQMVMEKLTLRLSNEEIKDLLARSLAYKLGQIGFGGYYAALKSLCIKRGILLQKTPEFDRYIQYVALADGLNTKNLFEAVAALEKQVIAEKAKAPEQKRILDQSQLHRLTDHLIHFTLTPQEWQEYKFYPVRMRISHRETFESFYVEAEKRSQLMVDNLLASPSEGPRAIITGGFHTPEVAALLKKKKISYLVFTPRITHFSDENSTAYLSLFAQAKSSLDELFRGERLFINPVSQNISSSPTSLAELASYHSRERKTNIVNVLFRQTIFKLNVKKGPTAGDDLIEVYNRREGSQLSIFNESEKYTKNWAWVESLALAIVLGGMVFLFLAISWGIDLDSSMLQSAVSKYLTQFPPIRAVVLGVITFIPSVCWLGVHALKDKFYKGDPTLIKGNSRRWIEKFQYRAGKRNYFEMTLGAFLLHVIGIVGVQLLSARISAFPFFYFIVAALVIYGVLHSIAHFAWNRLVPARAALSFASVRHLSPKDATNMFFNSKKDDGKMPPQITKADLQEFVDAMKEEIENLPPLFISQVIALSIQRILMVLADDAVNSTHLDKSHFALFLAGSHSRGDGDLDGDINYFIFPRLVPDPIETLKRNIEAKHLDNNLRDLLKKRGFPAAAHASSMNDAFSNWAKIQETDPVYLSMYLEMWPLWGDENTTDQVLEFQKGVFSLFQPVPNIYLEKMRKQLADNVVDFFNNKYGLTDTTPKDYLIIMVSLMGLWRAMTGRRNPASMHELLSPLIAKNQISVPQASGIISFYNKFTWMRQMGSKVSLTDRDEFTLRVMPTVMRQIGSILPTELISSHSALAAYINNRVMPFRSSSDNEIRRSILDLILAVPQTSNLIPTYVVALSDSDGSIRQQSAHQLAHTRFYFPELNKAQPLTVEILSHIYENDLIAENLAYDPRFQDFPTDDERGHPEVIARSARQALLRAICEGPLSQDLLDKIPTPSSFILGIQQQLAVQQWGRELANRMKINESEERRDQILHLIKNSPLNLGLSEIKPREISLKQVNTISEVFYQAWQKMEIVEGLAPDEIWRRFSTFLRYLLTGESQVLFAGRLSDIRRDADAPYDGNVFYLYVDPEKDTAGAIRQIEAAWEALNQGDPNLIPRIAVVTPKERLENLQDGLKNSDRFKFLIQEECLTLSQLEFKSLAANFLQEKDLHSAVFRFLVPPTLNMPGFLPSGFDSHRYRFYAFLLDKSFPPVVVEFRGDQLGTWIETVQATLRNA